jgi:hypothetical protein
MFNDRPQAYSRPCGDNPKAQRLGETSATRFPFLGTCSPIQE